MNLSALALPQAAAWALVASRAAGFVVTSPIPGNHVESQQRIGLVCLVSWLAASLVPLEGVPYELDARLVGAALSEVAVGLMVGFVLRLTMSAADVLGAMISQATGLATPSVLNPAVESQDAVLGRVVTLVAILIALALGAHRVALAYLLASYRAFPVGTLLDLPDTAIAMVDWAGDALAMGVRLAIPALAVSLVVQLALALVARAAPSLQIFSVGLTVLAAAGCLTIFASLDRIGVGLGSYIDGLAPRYDRLFEILAGRAP